MNVGTNWRVLEGTVEGQTQVDHPQDSNVAKWGHPIDIHLATKGLQGWPKLHVQVWHEDFYGRHEIYGYGVCHVPTTPGMHEIECVCWKPVGSFLDQMKSFFLGGGPELLSVDLIHSSEKRQRLRTESTGNVCIKIGVILRNFDKFGVEVT
jgi:B9 domain-containing protein 2